MLVPWEVASCTIVTSAIAHLLPLSNSITNAFQARRSSSEDTLD